MPLRSSGAMLEQFGDSPTCYREWMSLISASFLFGNPEKTPWVICFIILLASTVYVKYIKQEYQFKILLKHRIMGDKIIMLYFFINTHFYIQTTNMPSYTTFSVLSKTS